MPKDKQVYKESLALDSNRQIDDNGYLHIAVSPLTKETVNPYWGREIPEYEKWGLDPEKQYRGYRSGAELQKALPTFNGIPLLIDHKMDSAALPLKEERIGSVGTNAEWKPPYVMNALTVTDAYAIDLIKSGEQKELSACYRYDPVFESGTFNGMEYDFIMTNIKANHVAIVDEGRAGSDVYVYDRKPNKTVKEKNMPKKVEDLKQAFEGFASAFKGFLDEESGEPTHADDNTSGDTENPKEQDALTEGAKEDEGTQSIGQATKDAMDKAGCDAENPAEQKAFAEGVKYGESKEKEEPKKLDSEHQSTGTKEAMDETTSKKPQVAQDRQFAFDRALRRAEERGADMATSKIRTIYEAADAVRSTIAIRLPMAYDSATDIYEKALKIEGVSLSGVDKSAYRNLYLAVARNKSVVVNPMAGAAADKAATETVFSKNIKIED